MITSANGMTPITYIEHPKLLMDAGKEDDWMAPKPRIR
jgi:hypothetical protein